MPGAGRLHPALDDSLASRAAQQRVVQQSAHRPVGGRGGDGWFGGEYLDEPEHRLRAFCPRGRRDKDRACRLPVTVFGEERLEGGMEFAELLEPFGVEPVDGVGEPGVGADLFGERFQGTVRFRGSGRGAEDEVSYQGGSAQ
jgi:hypothetical protein